MHKPIAVRAKARGCGGGCRAGETTLNCAMPSDAVPLPPAASRRPIRRWPAWLILGLGAVAVTVIRTRADLPYQSRNLATLVACVIAGGLLWLWWLLLSRAPWRWRLLGCGGAALLVGLGVGLFRIRGVSGDLMPILTWRWNTTSVRGAAGATASAPGTTVVTNRAGSGGPAFPQFLGPGRDGVIPGTELERDWAAHPPRLVWRQPIGAGWSGFALVGERALTQEQAGEEELVTCYELGTGKLLWRHADAAHYNTTIAGEGPRCTPTVAGDLVFTLGATGILNCFDLATGRSLWRRDLTKDAEAGAPGWGFSGSPLVHGDHVIVSGGGGNHRSLLAYRVSDGEIAWTGGDAPAGYSSPAFAVLAGTPQYLLFNARRITAHAPDTGAVLWEYPWGLGQPHVAQPVVVSDNRVVFSSGYGVGAELLKVGRGTNGAWSAQRIWKSPRLKSKFANFFALDGHLYGLDDGVLACVSLADGTQKWREGRYGHGQMLRCGPLLLVMAENGELVLLAPTPAAPNELHRHRVFDGKTWNPPALAGDWLLVRNDQQAACLRLSLAASPAREQAK